MTLLRLANVEAHYGAVCALRGISIDVPEGAIVCLLGANGAGKSTTLKAISGVVRPSVGTIEFDGQPLSGLSPNHVVGLGIAQVPEGRKIFRDLTVFENLQMGPTRGATSAASPKTSSSCSRCFPGCANGRASLAARSAAASSRCSPSAAG